MDKDPDFSFSPSETRRLSLPQTCSAIELNVYRTRTGFVHGAPGNPTK